MYKITYKGNTYYCREQESVLDALLRQGVALPFSCHKGVCQVCMRKCGKGELPELSRKDIPEDLVQQGYFLPCQCVPVSDMEIQDPVQSDFFVSAVVQSRELLASDICRLTLETSQPLDFQPGQFVNLKYKNEDISRSYSIASLPDDYFLELHVRRQNNGVVSSWLVDEVEVGDEILVQGPLGDFVYEQGQNNQKILFIASGTGMAPVLGVLREAIAKQHTGPMFVYHGSHYNEGIYLDKQLRRISEQNSNVEYYGCVSGDDVAAGMRPGRAHDQALADHPDMSQYKVYIAGRPEMVAAARATVITAGAVKQNILIDPFEMKDIRTADQSGASTFTRRSTDSPASADSVVEAGYPSPDPEIWETLEQGKRLRPILQEFYDRVYEDPQLSPYFSNVTKNRLIEKQYSFLRQIFTGEKVYFGDRPRNAHHWMVISDELFDYRENLMFSIIRDHGVPPDQAERWREVESYFRPDIVKERAWGRLVDGVEMPAEGFDEVILDIGYLCDGCEQEVAPGTLVRYHVRTGKTYCPLCSQSGVKTVPV